MTPSIIPHQMITPIFSRIPYYYPLLDNDNFSSVYTKPLETVEYIKEPFPLKLISSSKTSHHIVGRIQKMTKLIWFPKDITYPFKFELLLGDGNSTLSVTFWNQCAFRYFNSLEIGDLVCIKGYEVHKGSQHQIFTSKVDVSCNDDKVVLRKVSNLAQFAPLNFNILTSDKLMTRSEFAFSFLGVIVCTGDMERIRDEKGVFAQYRMIKMKDNRSFRVVTVKVYSNSQIDKLNQFKVGQVLFLTDLENFVVESEIYASTTIASRFYQMESLTSLTIVAGKASVLDKALIKFNKWMQEQTSTLAGFKSAKCDLCTPPQPMKTDDFAVYHPEVIFFNTLDKVCDGLAYKETKLVQIKATLVSVTIAVGGNVKVTKIHSKGIQSTSGRKTKKSKVAQEDLLQYDTVITLELADINNEGLFHIVTLPQWSYFDYETNLIKFFHCSLIDNINACIHKSCDQIYTCLLHIHNQNELKLSILALVQ